MTVLIDIDTDVSATLRDLELFLMCYLHEEEMEYFMSALGSVMIYALLDDNMETGLESLDAFIFDPGQDALMNIDVTDLNRLMSACTTILDAWFLRYSKNPPDWLKYFQKGPGFITTYDIFYVEWKRGYRYAEIT